MKYITVPKNQNIQEQLNFNEAKSDDLHEYEFLDSTMHHLSENGFFIKINNLLNVNIEEYEDYEITDTTKLITLKKYIFDYIKTNKNISNIELDFYQNLLHLTEKAITYNTGLFFFL